ncbi:HNH endonuclease [Actinokineospora sp. NPDC004072]
MRGGGYDDAPSSHYSWDSTVPNSQGPQPGDGVVLWDGKALIGTSIIDAIHQGRTDKAINKCPECGKGRIKLRRKEQPRFRCDPCGAKFDHPATRVEAVTTYRAQYQAGWMELAGRLSGDELRVLSDRPKSQHSIRRIDLARFWAALGHPRATPFEAALGRWVDGHTTRIARVRLGQAEFRRSLIDRFGNMCAFTGPGPLEALQAAHLYSYAKSGKHDPHGGWLMRSDLHDLFDVGHIAVDPTRLVINVSPDVRAYPAYGALHDQSIKVAVEPRHRDWLALHWSRNR